MVIRKGNVSFREIALASVSLRKLNSRFPQIVRAEKKKGDQEAESWTLGIFLYWNAKMSPFNRKFFF